MPLAHRWQIPAPAVHIVVRCGLQPVTLCGSPDAQHPGPRSDRDARFDQYCAARIPYKQRDHGTICYSIRRPEIARPMTSCWICSVPSKMS